MEIMFLIPGKAVGKGRPRFARRGSFTTTYTPEKTASYESLIKVVASAAMQGKQLIENPVEININIHSIPPKSWSKKKQLEAFAGLVLPTVKPDADNIIKSICDAINGIVWRDDTQAVRGSWSKIYSDREYVGVTIREITRCQT